MKITEMEVKVEHIIEVKDITTPYADKPQYDGVSLMLKSIYYSPKGEKLFEVDRGTINMSIDDILSISAPTYRTFIPVQDGCCE